MVDLSFLEKFTKGNISKMRRYISLYLEMAPETFKRMQQNVEDQSWSELAVNAHSLKPQADLMGITSLKDVLIEIEKKVESAQLNVLENLFEQAQSIHKESETYLQDFVENS